MKLTFSINSMNCGGAERVISILANAFVIHGHDVEIVVQDWPQSFYPLHKDVAYVNIPSQKSKNEFFYRIRALRKYLKISKPDVIISFIADHNVVSCLANCGLKSKLIVCERNDPAKRPESKFMRIVRNISYCLADYYVFQTEEEKDYFGKRIREKSRVIMNPIDNMQLIDVKKWPRKKQIAIVGRLTEQKRVENAIKAFGKVIIDYPEYELHILGDGKLKGQLEEITKSLNLEAKVVFHGKEKNAVEEISDMSIFVLPSDFEGMPNALMEAMAMGLACISTDCPVGGPRALIDSGENGILVPVNDVHAIEQALHKLMLDENLQMQLGIKATKIRQTASVESVFVQWEACVRETLQK